MKPATFKQFVTATSSPASLLQTEAKQIVEHFRPFAQVISNATALTYTIHFSSHGYLYMENTCPQMPGYEAEFILENASEGAFHKWHPGDLEIFNSKVWPDDLSFFNALPVEEFPDYIVTCNARMRNAKGTYTTLLQRYSIIGDIESGAMTGAIGVAFDITHHKTDNSVIHTIEKMVSTANGLVNELVFKKVHPVFDDGKTKLTSRESQILQLIAKGMSSKQIAACLQVSAATVSNHRKNMLAKTGSQSSSGLTTFGLKHGMI